MSDFLPVEIIFSKIFVIRGKRVIFDNDLAELYGVKTGRLNEQVSRNIKRFPEDFMFVVTKEELLNLKSQFAISSWGGSRKPRRVFTQEGVAMLSSVLNSERAIMVNIHIMRVFVQLRRMVFTNKDLKRKVDEMERKYDKQFAIVFQAFRQLLEIHPEKEKPPIGFHK